MKKYLLILGVLCTTIVLSQVRTDSTNQKKVTDSVSFLNYQANMATHVIYPQKKSFSWYNVWRDLSDKSALSLGYLYTGKNVHAGYIGVDRKLIAIERRYSANQNIIAGAGVYLSVINEKFIPIPAIHFNGTWEILLLDFTASTKYIQPSVGLNFLNIATLKFGYSSWYNDSRRNSFAVGLCFNIGRDNFYTNLPIGW